MGFLKRGRSGEVLWSWRALVAEETKKKFQGALDPRRGLIEDPVGRSTGHGAWTIAAVVADRSEYGKLVVG